MRGFIFISNFLFIFISLFCFQVTFAEGFGEDGLIEEQTQSPVAQPEAEDFSGTPYTEYGEFNEDEEEAENALFYQHGRFFGVSAGFGFEGVSGNRGLLYQGGFPLIDVRLHAWFNFNLAFQIQLNTASHSYLSTTSSTIDVSIFYLGADLKYYVDVRNLSAALTFANPYFLVGVGSFSKTETEQNNSNTDAVDEDSSFGFSFGGGFEFPIVHRKSYVNIEAKGKVVSFKDSSSTSFSERGIADLSGIFWTATISVLFTW